MNSKSKNVFEKWLSADRSRGEVKEVKERDAKNDKLVEENVPNFLTKESELRNIEEKPQEWTADIHDWKRENKTKLKEIEIEINNCKQNVERDKLEIATVSKENEALKQMLAEQEVLKNEAEHSVKQNEVAILKLRDQLCRIYEKCNSTMIYETKQKELAAAEHIKYEQLSHVYNTLEARCNENITTLEVSIKEVEDEKNHFEQQIRTESDKLKLSYAKFNEKKALQKQIEDECSELKDKISNAFSEETRLENVLQDKVEKLKKIGDLCSKMKEIFDRTESQLNSQFANLDNSLSRFELRLNEVKMKLQKVQEKRLNMKKERDDVTKKIVDLDNLIVEQELAKVKLEEKMKASESKFRAQQAKNNEFMTKLEDLQKQNESLKSIISKATDDTDTDKCEFDSKVEEKDREIAALREKVEERKREFENKRQKMEDYKLEQNKTGKELEYLNKQIETIKNKKCHKDSNHEKTENISLSPNGLSKKVSSDRKQLNPRKDSLDMVYSIDSDTEDESAGHSKQLSLSKKSYSKEKEDKTVSRKSVKNNEKDHISEGWF